MVQTLCETFICGLRSYLFLGRKDDLCQFCFWYSHVGKVRHGYVIERFGALSWGCSQKATSRIQQYRCWHLNFYEHNQEVFDKLHDLIVFFASISTSMYTESTVCEGPETTDDFVHRLVPWCTLNWLSVKVWRRLMILCIGLYNKSTVCEGLETIDDFVHRLVPRCTLNWPCVEIWRRLMILCIGLYLDIHWIGCLWRSGGDWWLVRPVPTHHTTSEVVAVNFTTFWQEKSVLLLYDKLCISKFLTYFELLGLMYELTFPRLVFSNPDLGFLLVVSILFMFFSGSALYS